MAGSTSQPTHEMDYIVIDAGQHFLVLKPLDEQSDTVVVKIDEVTSSHLIG
jgi:hypothetical protein